MFNAGFFNSPVVPSFPLVSLERKNCNREDRSPREILAEMRRFLGCDPESVGIPVVDEIRGECGDFVPLVWSAERVQYISHQLPPHFGAAIWPLIAKREAAGQDWSGLELAEEAKVVDRWAVGYVTSRGTVYGTLLLRVRGLWVLWPPVR